MRRLVWLTAFFGLLVYDAASKAAEPPELAGMTKAHNEVRRSLKLLPLTWSDELAEDALVWASQLADNGCRMRHDETPDGENLFWASPLRWSDGRKEKAKYSARQVVKAWADEVADYDYASNRCRPGAVCGHYTQIVWADTRMLGCARAFCPSLGQIWACRYRPTGNYVGQRPY